MFISPASARRLCTIVLLVMFNLCVAKQITKGAPNIAKRLNERIESATVRRLIAQCGPPVHLGGGRNQISHPPARGQPASSLLPGAALARQAPPVSASLP